MTESKAEAGVVVDLIGSAFERGRQQAERCSELAEHVHRAVAIRMKETEAALAMSGVKEFLEGMVRFAEDNDSEMMEEIAGIGEGFGIPKRILFDYINLSLVADLDSPPETDEECTAWAISHPNLGAVVAKNRDYRREHIAIQKVFRHRDPAWRDREILCVGSLGSPGNFSSGINSDGLAVVDTASRTTSHGVGRHRFFLMTRLLVNCATVAEALADIASARHAGGGLLTLADASGTVATVELGHDAAGIEMRMHGWVARTNHFVTELMAPYNRRGGKLERNVRNSERRLATLRRLLSEPAHPLGLAEASRVMSRHGEGGGEALCRHGDGHISQTISGHMYATASKSLWFAEGNPCEASWKLVSLAGPIAAPEQLPATA